MITNINTTPAFDALSSRLKNLGEELFDGLRPMDENALIESGSNMSSPEKVGQNMVFMLTDGNVPAMLDDRVLFYYEPGELIGLDCAFGCTNIAAKLEFAVRANIYDRAKIFKKIRKDAKRFDLLMEYVAVHSSMMHLMLSATLAASKRPSFQMKNFKAGENIIEQGATDMDVYSMITGVANVLVDENTVGKIKEGEIFGEMSRLTGAPRSATVRAECNCEVMVFGGDDFTNLAETNPVALKEIAVNLSERLAKLDQQLGKS